MTIRSYSAAPRTSFEAILPGYCCGVDTDAVDLIDDATQATTVTVVPLGVSATETSASGQEIAVVDFGEVTIVAGTGGLARGQFFVAEALTGKCLPFTPATYTDGQTVYLMGRALEAIAANASGRGWVQIQAITISKP